MSAILKQNAIDIANAFEKYGLWKGGESGVSGIVYGGIDVSNVIHELTSSVDGTEWTATEDCYFIGELVSSNAGCNIMIDGVPVAVNFDTSLSSIYFPIFVLKGQTIKYFALNNNYIRTAKIYGVKKSEKILHEYSTEEKIVGKWIDGKNIYEQIFIIGSKNANYTFTIDKLENIINYSGFCTINDYKRSIPFIQVQYNNYVIINEYKDGIVNLTTNLSYTDCILIIQYTKTTD